MQTLRAENLGKMLRSGQNGVFAGGLLFEKPGNTNYGAGGNPFVSACHTSSAFDSFSITENISELLSPACGMSEEEKSAYLAHIKAKLKSGIRLTAEEMRFLQSVDPILYQQAARVQAMRDSLEAQLKSATSKQNAAELFSASMSMIPDEDPMKEYIIAAYEAVMREFKASDTYQALPEKDETPGK